jgi:hypothetical protein
MKGVEDDDGQLEGVGLCMVLIVLRRKTFERSARKRGTRRVFIDDGRPAKIGSTVTHYCVNPASQCSVPI